MEVRSGGESEGEGEEWGEGKGEEWGWRVEGEEWGEEWG